MVAPPRKQIGEVIVLIFANGFGVAGFNSWWQPPVQFIAQSGCISPLWRA